MAIEIHYERHINNTAIIRDVDTRHQREYLLLTLLAGLFVLGLLFYGWQEYRYIQAGYEIESALKHKEELAEYNNQLTLMRNSLARLERVETKARHELGMVTAAPGQLVTVTFGSPAVPGPADATPPLTARK